MDSIDKAYDRILNDQQTDSLAEKLLAKGWRQRKPLGEVFGTHGNPDLLKDLGNGITAYVFSGWDDGYEDKPVYAMSVHDGQTAFGPEDTYSSLEELMNEYIAWYAENKEDAATYPELQSAEEQVGMDFNEALTEEFK